MKSLKKVFIIVIASLLHGCISFRTGPERNFEEASIKNQLTIESLSGVKPNIRYMWNASGNAYYKLKLIAEGSFVKHIGHCVKRGKPNIAVGFWPGVADANDGFDVWSVCFLSAVQNFGLFGLPTLSSLFVEPFRDYRSRNYMAIISYTDIGDYGLIGVCKYYRDVQDVSFNTTSRERVSWYALWGYTVMIDGQKYEDGFRNEYDGEIWFSSNRPRGSQISIRIVGAPTSRSDGKDNFSDLVGMEILTRLP